MSVALSVSLTGCGMNDVSKMTEDMVRKQMGDIQPGQRLEDSAWINTDLPNAVDASTEVSCKDDFHAFVNRDWLLNAYADTSQEDMSAISDIAKVADQQLYSLFRAGDNSCDTGIMPQAEADHLQKLLLNATDLAGNQEKRDALGVEPLRPYIQAIDSIATMDELTAYLANEGGPNLIQDTFVNAEIGAPVSTRDVNTVHLSGPQNLLLDDPYQYTWLNNTSYNVLQLRREAVQKLLAQMGYTAAQAQKMFDRCLWLEVKLSGELPTVSEMQDAGYEKQINHVYTLDQLKKRQGLFPLTELLEKSGLAKSETFLLYQPLYLSLLGKLYTPGHLEDFKAYLAVHTALEALPLLDTECVAMSDKIHATRDPEKKNEDDPNKDSKVPPIPTDDTKDKDTSDEAEKKLEEIVSTYVQPILAEPIQELYIARFCTAESKRNLSALVEDITGYYKEMLQNEEWLGGETRQKAVEKLDNIKIRVLYPDVLTDYSGLELKSYDDGGTLLDAYANTERFRKAMGVSKVNQPIDRGYWDLESIPTSEVNAMYMPQNNSINILAGFIANGFTYDANASKEQNYARIGMVVGHEISHAFDTMGYKYDKDGLETNWWTNADEVSFQTRANRLANFYSALSVIPNMKGGYDGNGVKTEAIADMGGMKCMLGLAEKEPNFDYRQFFTAYAQLWAGKHTYSHEMLLLSDPHPLFFLRTDVTVQQFEKFYETFDIQPGDGMYLAPEKRILVW